jgi:broad specificity phosphatase PhoE
VTQVDLDAAAAAAAERPGRRLVVVRHGQTAWNAAGRAQGHADIELDDAGHAQAAAAAPYLASLEPSALWTSDLARARQTSEYLEKATGLSSREDARLREFDVGLRQGLTIPEFAARYPAEHAAWVRRDDALRVPGAESDTEVAARIVPAMRECLASLAPGCTGIMVTHGASLKVGVVALLGWPAELESSLRGIDNCAWVTVEAPAYDAPLRLVGYNESVRPGHDAPARLPDEG